MGLLATRTEINNVIALPPRGGAYLWARPRDPSEEPVTNECNRRTVASAALLQQRASSWIMHEVRRCPGSPAPHIKRTIDSVVPVYQDLKHGEEERSRENAGETVLRLS